MWQTRHSASTPAISGEPLVVAVPDLEAYHPHTGIGRVFSNLRSGWNDRVRLISAQYRALDIPVLRHMPFAVQVPSQAELVLAPRLTGAQALRDTGHVPSMVILHDIGIVDCPQDRDGMGWLTHQAILQSFWGLRHASHIIAVSEFTRDRLFHYLPELRGRVSVIHTTVARALLDHSPDKVGSRMRIANLIGYALDDPLLLYVGTETPRKNIPLLLRVLRQVKDRYPRAQLLKVGQPGLPQWRASTLDLARSLGLRVGRDILILEKIDDATLADAYNAADVFISASLYEGFGLPALEAMAVGTPVVVTNRGSFPEIVGQVGWVVEPELDPLAQAAVTAICDPRAQERALDGRGQALRFTPSLAADRYLEIMTQVGRQR